MGRVRIPPDHITVLLPIDDRGVIARLALIRTPGLGLTGLEVLPVHGSARQVPAARKVGFPEGLYTALVARVGDDDAIDLNTHFASRGENVDAVIWVFRVIQHLCLLLVPRIESLEVDLDQAREFRVECIGHEERRDRFVTNAQLRGRRLDARNRLVVRERCCREEVGLWDPILREELVLPDQLCARGVEDPFTVEEASDSLVCGHDLWAKLFFCVEELRGDIG